MCSTTSALREPARIFACAGPWTAPGLVYIFSSASLFSAGFAFSGHRRDSILVLFWWLRLTELASPSRKPPNPLRLPCRACFGQPRFGLAWGLAGPTQPGGAPSTSLPDFHGDLGGRRDRFVWHRLDLYGTAVG